MYLMIWGFGTSSKQASTLADLSHTLGILLYDYKINI